MGKYTQLNVAGLALLLSFAVNADNSAGNTPSITPRMMADMLHTVIEAGRTVYSQTIVDRLAKQEDVIEVTEHYDDEKALALPAQLFRLGAEMVDERVSGTGNMDFSYSLRSLWPVREKNAPQNDIEEAGLRFVAENKDENYYAEETVGDRIYFMAVYADTAVAPVCVSCHNTHKYSPRRDFELGDVMGGIVIRIGLSN